MTDERLGQHLSENFKENKKMFWRGVNGEQKTKEQMYMRIKDLDGNILTEERAVQSRWREYHEQQNC